MSKPSYDVTIIGAGIVGLATAYALIERHPDLKITVLEKEQEVALHQTGNNSGVIHSGVYYQPGSLKAQLCIDGARQLIRFCEAHGIPFHKIGKVIVATDAAEVVALEELYQRGLANGVPGIRLIEQSELQEIEPHAAGVRAIHSPTAAIVNFRDVAMVLAEQLRQRGVCIETGAEVLEIARRGNASHITTITTPGIDIQTRYLINCAGLYSDRIASLAGAQPQVRIVPFRGEYYHLKPERSSLVRGLIYPVPDPTLPFLGVHFTPTMSGVVEAGPNAVLALGREAYGRADVHLKELFDTLSFPGFWKLAGRYWQVGAYEYYRSFSKTAFLASLRKLVPSINGTDIVRGGAGVRAQAVDNNGRLVDDFSVVEDEGALHVLNAPSPAATASLAIGNYLAELAAKRIRP